MRNHWATRPQLASKVPKFYETFSKDADLDRPECGPTELVSYHLQLLKNALFLCSPPPIVLTDVKRRICSSQRQALHEYYLVVYQRTIMEYLDVFLSTQRIPLKNLKLNKIHDWLHTAIEQQPLSPMQNNRRESHRTCPL